MGSLKDPKTWIPHINPKDCSHKNCNIYCTQWCNYIILPSPPPPPLPADDLGGTTTFSPVVIVIIALISIFFLVTVYCIIISRYCLRNNDQSSVSLGFENQENLDSEMGVDDDQHGEDYNDQSSYVPWLVLGKGLDEALIKSITMCKYKREDGLVSCTDCLVCLGEFQEDESIRVLPKCSHAFHVYCIDTWLKNHSNCPLCRAKVCFEDKASTVISPPPPLPPPLLPPVNMGDLGGSDNVVVEIREDKRRKIRRSKSMGYLCRSRSSIADIWLIDQAEETRRQELRNQSDVGSSYHISTPDTSLLYLKSRIKDLK